MTATAQSLSPSATAAEEETLYARLTWRIMPVLLTAYVVAYLDRVNIGYAQLQMKSALGLSDAAFGLGAGIMFIGYALFELPSNLLLERVGARKTLLRIMLCWGLTASATMFVRTPAQFYIARFLLGGFEAGFFPGVILYLTYWYPAVRRGRAAAIFMSGPIVAGIIAGPISGATMKYLDGAQGFAGWQWLYLTQGLPAIALGFVAYLTLQDKPAQASWLSPESRNILIRNVAQDKAADADSRRSPIVELLRDPKVYVLALVDFLLVSGAYVMVFWGPTLVKSWGVTDILTIGLCLSVPSIAGVIGMILLSRSSDKRRDRRWHFMTATALGALGLAATLLTQGQVWASMLGLCVAAFGIVGANPLYIATTSEYLSPRHAASGLAIINTLGILGGAVGPAVTGWLNARTGTVASSLYFVIAELLVAGLLLLAVSRGAKKPSV